MKPGYAVSIDEYVSTFPKDVQRILTEIRKTIRNAVPDAVEAISYQIPTFKLRGRNVVHFAGYKSHVSVYPVPSGGSDAFRKKLAKYRAGKGTLRFSLDDPLPRDVVAKVVKLLVEDAADRESGKKGRRSAKVSTTR